MCLNQTREIRHKAVTTTEPWHSNFWSKGVSLDKEKSARQQTSKTLCSTTTDCWIPTISSGQLESNKPVEIQNSVGEAFHCKLPQTQKDQTLGNVSCAPRQENTKGRTLTGVHNHRQEPASHTRTPHTTGHTNPPVRVQSSDPPPGQTRRPGWYRHTACFLQPVNAHVRPAKPQLARKRRATTQSPMEPDMYKSWVSTLLRRFNFFLFQLTTSLRQSQRQMIINTTERSNSSHQKMMKEAKSVHKRSGFVMSRKMLG